MRVSVSRLGVIASFVAVLSGGVSRAAATTQSVSYTYESLTFTLKVPTQAQVNAKTTCELDLTLTGSDYAFTASDSIDVGVYTDGGVFSSTTIFSSTLTPTAAEVSAHKIQRTIDCSGTFGTTTGDSVSVYASVETGLGGFFDDENGESDDLTVQIVATVSGGTGTGGTTTTCTGTGTATQDCGTCGTQTRTCQSGTWSTWSTCIEGSCGTDDTSDGGSTDGGDSDSTDSSSTGSKSTHASGSNSGKVGLACDDNTTCGNLTCLGDGDDSGTGMFHSGYCSMDGCKADSACGDSNALCGGLFGDTFCLEVCTNATDCRTDYICVRFGGDKACAPRCRANTDCTDKALPVCDDDSGLCLANAGADATAWNGARPNADRSSVNATAQDPGTGCAETGQSSWLFAIAGLLVVVRVVAQRVAAKHALQRSSV